MRNAGAQARDTRADPDTTRAPTAMPSRETTSTAPVRSTNPVRVWLYSLAILVVAMVAVGGATRLTGSGLSITEWRPVTGVVPPVSEQAWAAEFDKYKDTPQYRILNQGMGLADFKVLYAWEWGHRLLGRIVGLVFFLPLLWCSGGGAPVDAIASKFGLLGLGAPRWAPGCHRLDHGRLRPSAWHDRGGAPEARPTPHHREPDPGRPRLAGGRVAVRPVGAGIGSPEDL